MNDSRHGTAQPGLIFGIKLRELFFADVFDVLFHVFLGPLAFWNRPALTQRRPLLSQAGSCLGHVGSNWGCTELTPQPTFAFKT